MNLTKSKFGTQIKYKDKVIYTNLIKHEWFRINRSYSGLLDQYIDNNIEESLIRKSIAIKYGQEVLKNFNTLIENLKLIGYITTIDGSDSAYNLDTISLSLTNRCNLHCNHCILSASPSNKDILSTRELLEIIDEISEVNPRHLIVSGGEPFVRKDIMTILRHIRTSFKGEVCVMTNGVSFGQHNLDEVCSLVDEFSISLDGFDEDSCSVVRGPHVFKKVLKSIEQLKAAGAKNISLSEVYTRDNYINQDRFRLLCSKLHVHPVFRPYLPEGRAKNWNDKNVFPINEVIENTYCYYCDPGKKELLVSYDGSVYPCANLIQEKLCYGNLRNDKNLLHHIKSSYRITEQIQREILLQRPQFNKPCNSCPVNMFCWECVVRYRAISTNPEKFREFCDFKKPKLMQQVWGEK